MISKVSMKLRRRDLVLGVAGLAALAIGFGVGSSGAARAGRPAADGARTSVALTVRSTRYGRILFDGRGRALYAFTRDQRGGSSRCYWACAKAWPVYVAKGRPLVGKGVRQSLTGTTKRRDGARQITYNGRPLYYYVGDKATGEVRCQNVDEFGGTWLVVRPNGQLVQ
jgi:predicted lipoprotein with Yx(FWY)xxD motif